MLELTPPLEPGSGRLAVHVMEPGGSLWLSRTTGRRFRILLVPPTSRERLARLLREWDSSSPGLTLYRHTTTGTVQTLPLWPADVQRLAQALLELERFETNPDLPEWRERGYVTEAEAQAVLDAHPEWFEEGDPDAAPL